MNVHLIAEICAGVAVVSTIVWMVIGVKGINLLRTSATKSRPNGATSRIHRTNSKENFFSSVSIQISDNRIPLFRTVPIPDAQFLLQ